MKKKTSNNTEDKSMFKSAGEVIGAIGHEIVAGKDKVVELAHTVAGKFTEEKKVVTKKTKKVIKSAKKVIPKKAALKKEVKKVITKTKKLSKNAATKTKKVAKKAPKIVVKKK